MKKSISKSVRKPSDPDKLTPVQKKAVNLIMEGMPMAEVAQKVGRCRQTLSGWKNHHPAFKAKLEVLGAEAEEELSFAVRTSAGFMLSQLRRLAQEGAPEISMKAIQYFFDRHPWPAPDADKQHPLLSERSDMVSRMLDQLRSREHA
jgi:hypothetical protein